MKNLIILLCVSITICLSTIQAQTQVYIPFVADKGTISHDTHQIIPISVVGPYVDPGGNPQIYLDVVKERLTVDAIAGVESWTGTNHWNAPSGAGWSPGTSSQQFVPLTVPGLYGNHIGGPVLGIQVNFLSDPFVKVDGNPVPGKPHLKDHTDNQGVIKINATTSVLLEISSIFAPPKGTNQFWDISNNVKLAENGTFYQITTSGNYSLRTGTSGNTSGIQYIDFQVTITPTTHTINATADSNGFISPNGAVQVNHGGSQTFTITPVNSCYERDQVLVNGINNTNAVSSGTYTFTNVTSNQTIHATFKQKPNLTITASAGPNGTITPSGNVSVPCGGSQTFNFGPSNTCYEIDQVLINNVNNPTAVAAGTYTFTNVTTNQTISVSFKQKMCTIQASAGANGTITPSGAVSVPCGENKTFNFGPSNTCYEIDQVLINNVNNPTAVAAGTYTFTNVTTNQTISVSFKIKKYTIIATSEGNGTISPSGNVLVDCGANQIFTFNPQSGYEVDQVKVDNVSVSFLNNQYQFTNVTANHTINVTFKVTTVPQCTITATAGPNGSINPSGAVIVNQGANQTFYFDPDKDYEVDEVKVDGELVAFSNNQYQFTNVDIDHSIYVTFKLTTVPHFTIIASAGSHGSIDPSGEITVNQGASQTFTFIPDPNYVIDQVFVDDIPVDSAGSYTFDNVTKDHTIHVTFKYYNSIDEVDPNAVNIYYHSGTIYLKNLQPGTMMQIIDMLGRVVYQTIPTGESISFSERGVYVVRVLHRTSQYTKKIVTY